MTSTALCRLREDVAAMAPHKPDVVTRKRWNAALDAARDFLFGPWSEVAASFGWTADDLLTPPKSGRHPGALWLLRGRSIVGVKPNALVLSDGNTLAKPRFPATASGAAGPSRGGAATPPMTRHKTEIPRHRS